MPDFFEGDEVAEELERPLPLHGNQGDRAPGTARPAFPLALTIAISREAGARGSTIARRVGAKLGWQVFSQELLEYISQEGTFRQDIFDHLPPAAPPWVVQRLEQLQQEQLLSHNPSVVELARMILSLGAQGEVVLLGRGAGYLLPAASTLHVRLVAPLADRIAYFSQWQRLTEAEAAERVRQRDQQRAEFLSTHLHRRPGDVHHYDLILNTSLLGEDLSTTLIVQAAQGKQAALQQSAEA